MKKLGRESEKLETLNLFSLLQSKSGENLYDPANHALFLTQVDTGLKTALDSESTLHGIRVQSMFHGMVANLDSVRLIKEEDSGDCYHATDQKILVPDFRVVTAAGESLFVETKNHFRKDPMKSYRIRSSDMDALQRYSDLSSVGLRFAIYWAPWNQWTLNDPSCFSTVNGYAEIGLLQAIRQSEMAVLGDYTIGTTYPLTLKMKADFSKPRAVSPEGLAEFTTGGWEIWSGDTLLDDKQEQNIAFYLMMYGKWEYAGVHVELDSQGLPVAAVHVVAPEDITPGQGFEMIGSLSSLYSRAYNSFTLEEGRVTRLTVNNPVGLAPFIPKDFQRKQLPLWRFILQPNRDQEAPMA